MFFFLAQHEILRNQENIRAYVGRSVWIPAVKEYPFEVYFPNLFDITKFHEMYIDESYDQWWRKSTPVISPQAFDERFLDCLEKMSDRFRSATLSELHPFNYESVKGSSSHPFSGFISGVYDYINRASDLEEQEQRMDRMMIYIERWSRFLTWIEGEVHLHNGVANFYQSLFVMIDKFIMISPSGFNHHLKALIRKLLEIWTWSVTSSYPSS